MSDLRMAGAGFDLIAVPFWRGRWMTEQLDAAQTGEEFGQVLHGFLNALDKARWGDE